MGVCKRNDAECISYIFSGGRIREAIGPNRKKAESDRSGGKKDRADAPVLPPRNDDRDIYKIKKIRLERETGTR